MIVALASFVWVQVRPRASGVLIASETGVAAACGILVGLYGERIPLGAADTGDVVLTTLTYAAIAFGFSVAGLTIALSSLNEDFAKQLALTAASKRPAIGAAAPEINSYSNLLFIFTWTAIAHWAVVVASFGALAALGRDSQLLAVHSSLVHRAGVGLWAGATVYAVELFVVTVITLADVSGLYIKRLQS